MCEGWFLRNVPASAPHVYSCWALLPNIPMSAQQPTEVQHLWMYATRAVIIRECASLCLHECCSN